MSWNSIILWICDLLKVIKLVSGRNIALSILLIDLIQIINTLFIFLFIIFLPYQVKGSKYFKILELFA